MDKKNAYTLFAALPVALVAGALMADSHSAAVSDDVIAEQREALAAATAGAGFGPQSPRDIDAVAGDTHIAYKSSPPANEMNLCNLHFHEGTEHKGGEFTTYAGNGNGEGFGTGYLYSGELSDAEKAPIDVEIGKTEERDPLLPGTTIEVHYVYSTAQVAPGPTLGSCFNDAIANPQLRVETQVYVLVNDRDAMDFTLLTAVEQIDGFYQAPNIPSNTGDPIRYNGSTTGPGYNEKGSPYQVSWSVRPQVAKVDILTVGTWFEDNVFDENHAHPVRNLVINPSLLSQIGG